MFQNQYRTDNEQIMPDEALVEHLAVKMHRERGEAAPSRRRIRLARAVAATAASVCILAGSVGVYTNMNKQPSPAFAPAAQTTVTDGPTAEYTAAVDTREEAAPATTAKPTESAKPTAKPSEPVTVNGARLGSADYKEVFKVIQSLQKQYEYGTGHTAGNAVADGSAAPGATSRKGTNATQAAAANPPDSKQDGAGQNSGEFLETPNAPADETGDDASAGSEDYSDTNKQVEGVDEADIIKTDGKYIYALTQSELVIVEADKGRMKLVSRLNRVEAGEEQGVNSWSNEMYVKGNRLILTRSTYKAYDSIPMTDSAQPGCYASPTEQNAGAVIYDISDRAKPKLVKEMGQSGSLVSSRMVGNILYMVTNHYLSGAAEENNPATFVPKTFAGMDEKLLAPADICVSAQPQYVQYIVVTALDVTKPEQGHLSQKTVLGCGNTVYANTENMLVASYGQETKTTEKDGVRTDSWTNKTNFIRLSLNKGAINAETAGSVPGNILNQFSMDEFEGHFRIVTTVDASSQTTKGKGDQAVVTWNGGESKNALYTLNQKLEVVGKIEDVAPGERVYSVRFDGRTGYFVTFRQVDPLFTVDLADPKKPAILSALKIPGFSEYLHPYASGLLFGFGKDATESGRVTGLKLSMFNTADPKNVTEKHKLSLAKYQYSAASQNHKAILVSPDRGLIAFQADNKYVIFTYSPDKGFQPKAEVVAADEYYDDSVRGLYIGEYFYVFTNTSLRSYSLGSFELQQKLAF